MNTLTPGTKVIEKYRLPSPTQPWIHPVYVGTIVEPGDSIEAWNGRNSERTYCETCGYTKVAYSWGIGYDKTTAIIVLTEDQASMTNSALLRLFVGGEIVEKYIATLEERQCK